MLLSPSLERTDMWLTVAKYAIPVGSFLKKHSLALLCVAAVAGAFVLGRATAPVQVRTETKIVEKQTTVVEQKVDLNELKTVVVRAASDTQKDVDTKKTVVINKDGSKTITTETVDKSKTSTAKSEDTKADIKQVKNTASTSIVETQKTVVVQPLRLSPPDWLVGVQAGVSLPGLVGTDPGPNYFPYIPTRTSLGLTIDRRILGGVYGGIWINTRGEVGLGLRLAF
jgi:hypothetical protein